MKDLKRGFLSIALSCFLLTVLLPVSQNVGADGETERTYPSSVTVTYGTPAGVLANVVEQDGITYDVAEEDVGAVLFTNTTLNPDGTGTFTEWTTGVGADPFCDAVDHWGCVDEGPPSPGDGDATHVVDVNILVRTDTYTLEPYVLAGGHTIDEVEVYVTARRNVASTATISVAVYPGVALDPVGNYPLISNYVEYSVTWTSNPDTGVAWTEANINALEAGCQRWALEDSVFMTLVWVRVQSSSVAVDYTADYQFGFQGIGLRQKPRLEISGYRTGDVENILVQVARSGVWVTLDANVFDTTLTTTTLPLSTEDIAGGSANVRLIDADNTDNTQTTIFIDEIRIVTEGGAGGTSSPIDVFTKSEYKLWENRLKIDLMWYQTGGPEEAVALAKWVSVTIDGRSLHPGLFQMPTDKNFTYVPVPWNVLDGGMHNITVIGYVSVAWSSGAVTYQSDPERITADNLIRFIVIMLAFTFLIIVGLALVAKRLKDRSDLIESRTRGNDDST